MKRHAAILGTGKAIASQRATNADIGKRLGQDVDAWLVENVGIRERFFMADDERTSDLALVAAREALGSAGVPADEVDLVIVATDTPDYISPATAAVVQSRLGARRAGAYDLNAACSGWVTALDAASKTIVADERYRNVLVVGAYGMSRFIDWSDKRTATLFADGAGAVLVGESRTPGLLASRLLAFGELHEALGVFTGGTARPATQAAIGAHGAPHVEFVKRFPPTFNLEHWPALIHGTLGDARITLDDVDLFVFTQINLRTIEATMQALGQPMHKTHTTMDKWGYTGSACIPMTLDDAVKQGRLAPGKHVLFCASGGGVSMAAAVARWTMPEVSRRDRASAA